MSKKYPVAWGVLCTANPTAWVKLNGPMSDSADDTAKTYSIVQLIPLPEHESIVAAAVAAERERCAEIADLCRGASNRNNRQKHGYGCGWWAAADRILSEIREVPE